MSRGVVPRDEDRERVPVVRAVCEVAWPAILDQQKMIISSLQMEFPLNSGFGGGPTLKFSSGAHRSLEAPAQEAGGELGPHVIGGRPPNT